MMMGCTAKKYRVSFDSLGFKTAKTMYAPGDAVEVSYMVGTDMDYRFYSDDVDFDQDYDWQKGVILRFTMPEHDVKDGELAPYEVVFRVVDGMRHVEECTQAVGQVCGGNGEVLVGLFKE